MSTLTKTYELHKLGLNPGKNHISVTATASSKYKLGESARSNSVEINAGDVILEQIGDDNTWVVTGRGNMSAPEIVIPAEYKGVAVTKIASQAFKGETSLTGITIPTSIKHIGANAFENSGLTSITFDDVSHKVIFFESPGWGVPYVRYTYADGAGNNGDGHIMDLVDASKNIYSCSVPQDINTISFRSEDSQYETDARTIDSNGLNNRIFKTIKRTGASGVSYVLGVPGYYNPGTTFDKYGGLTIGSRAFTGCNRLRSLYLPQRLVNTEGSSFSNCETLLEAILPYDARLLEIGAGMFRECEQLETVLLRGRIRKIREYAFMNCLSLLECELDEGVEEIGVAAFQDCYCLTNIYIPSTVREIRAQAFKYVSQTGVAKWIQFANRYTWVTTPTPTVPDSGEGVTLWKPEDLYCANIEDGDAAANGRRLVYEYADEYWHRLEQMLPPQISIDGGTLSMTDPLGVAEEFSIYVNDVRKAIVFTNL